MCLNETVILTVKLQIIYQKYLTQDDRRSGVTKTLKLLVTISNIKCETHRESDDFVEQHRWWHIEVKYEILQQNGTLYHHIKVENEKKLCQYI